MRKMLALAILFVLALAACADSDGNGGSDPTENSWRLESGTLDGEAIPILDDHAITLTFDEEGGVGGTSACNSYFGGYTISGSEIAISDLGQTMMACSPEEVMDSETAYLEALAGVDSFAATDSQLTLTGDGVELVFVLDESE
ncbi:MAG TPA: META domain-containing protein [Acidimicrobiia bacterium]|nr:META domain-containing protein [Acidimicrobiia bacterium]